MNQKSVIKRELFEILKPKYPGIKKGNVQVRDTGRGKYLIRVMSCAPVVYGRTPAESPGVAVVNYNLIGLGYERVNRKFRSTSSIENWDAEVFPKGV